MGKKWLLWPTSHRSKIKIEDTSRKIFDFKGRQNEFVFLSKVKKKKKLIGKKYVAVVCVFFSLREMQMEVLKISVLER